MKPILWTRRAWLAAAAVSAPAAAGWPGAFRRRIAGYLERHARPGGGYGWQGDVTAQTTPTFAAVGCYRLLGLPAPDAKGAAAFLRAHYPVPERRRKERPLWRLDWEQVQALVWLGEPVSDFVPLARSWTGPAEFTRRYELGGNPVFQHQAMAVRVRRLLGIPPAGDDAWKDYFLARRRADGTFNSTPAKDGSPGHVMNTLWGLLALAGLDLPLSPSPALIEWLRACQLPSGGFTYAPGAILGAVDDVCYTWAALHALKLCGASTREPQRAAAYIESLFTAEGGYQDRPGGSPNPLATYYALDALTLLGHVPRASASPAPRAHRRSIPPGSRVFTIQIEAPGQGSPWDAVTLAEGLGIHIWCAKNAQPGWVEEAQRVAVERQVPVLFAIGDEEYGTFVQVPGLGAYSHLVDLVAPAGRSTGQPMPRKDHPYLWEEFRDTRIAALRKGGGRMIWQFLESEELTRVLLDEAAARGTYSAISAFHFGNENFLHSQPFLHRWNARLPFIALQDAHTREPWWWGDQLAGFRTLFAARDATWESWLEALDLGHVMAVRQDAVTRGVLHMAGGSPELRGFVTARRADWMPPRPPASLVFLRPGARFEQGAPQQGAALRLRLWADNTTQGAPKEARATLVELRVDGGAVRPELVETANDRYYLHGLDTPGPHSAAARVRTPVSGAESTVTAAVRTD